MLSANLAAQTYCELETNLSSAPDFPRWAKLGSLASSALIAEARLTPKPALVDQRGSGAHADLNLDLMISSAHALEPFFQEMARISLGAALSTRLREQLASCGRQAEISMYLATGGSNSHRGSIWCMGLLVASAAMLSDTASPEEIAQNAASIAVIDDRYAPKEKSHGSLVKQTYGVRGARAEAEDGFPHITKIALPHLRQKRLNGATETSARLDALMSIMAELDDTCLLYRGGMEALLVAKTAAKDVLALGGSSSSAGMARLFQLDFDLLKLRSSPGGSADLLAATLFLDSLSLTELSNGNA
ncbi:MAG: triphosphoribosyl-dephospho-CoA synthase [Candidatus Obscuribacterales bacterium]|nr:triphosphoribosyl-dephospho-CoA synthase [Candidatus Obscuribacterales bacterium]